jgi:hypothetical protein
MMHAQAGLAAGKMLVLMSAFLPAIGSGYSYGVSEVRPEIKRTSEKEVLFSSSEIILQSLGFGAGFSPSSITDPFFNVSGAMV